MIFMKFYDCYLSPQLSILGVVDINRAKNLNGPSHWMLLALFFEHRNWKRSPGHPCCFLSSVEPENATGNGPCRSEGPEVFQDHPLLASPCYFLFLFGHFTHSFLAVFQFLCPFHDLLGDQLISTKLPADQRSAKKSAADVCPKRNNFQTLEHHGTSTSKFPHWHGADPDL